MQNLIEEDRLLTMLNRDNANSPEKTRLILTSEVQRVVKDYLELKEEIKVRFKLVDEEIVFMIEMRADRIKQFGYMPKF